MTSILERKTHLREAAYQRSTERQRRKDKTDKIVKEMTQVHNDCKLRWFHEQLHREVQRKEAEERTQMNHVLVNDKLFSMLSQGIDEQEVKNVFSQLLML